MKIEDLTIWQAFLGVAKHGNFSKAAKALKVPLPQVSKRVSRLEDQLGVRLFQRTTRVVTLTDEGRALFARVEPAVEDIRDIETMFEHKKELSGTVRVASVSFVAHRLLLPVFKKFMAKYPGVHIEMELSEGMVNMVESGVDIAVRIDTPDDSSLIYRKLVPNDLIFVAAPSYLKKSPAIKSIKDLHKHDLLMMGIHKHCRLTKSKMKLGDFDKRKRISCDNGAYLTDLALNGMGVLVRSIWDVKPYLKDKKLVQVLKNEPIETFGHVYAVIPSRRYLAPRVRALFDFILEESKKWSV